MNDIPLDHTFNNYLGLWKEISEELGEDQIFRIVRQQALDNREIVTKNNKRTQDPMTPMTMIIITRLFKELVRLREQVEQLEKELVIYYDSQNPRQGNY